MDNTKIEWTNATWNALRGCSKVSAGCANCYAEGMAARFSDPGQWGHGIATREGGKHRWTGHVVLDEQALVKPLRWRKPRRVFVTSVSDPFHDAVTDAMLDRLFAVMALAPQHTFQLLTKRPERMRNYATTPRPIATAMVEIAKANSMADRHLIRCLDQPRALPNVWLGVSIEDQAAADERIPHLLATPAAVRFLSCEPLLGPVDLRSWTGVAPPIPATSTYTPVDGIERYDLTGGAVDGLGWVIAGGESGRNARPMHPAWPRALRDACALAGVPFFFKQWGEWASAKGLPGRIPIGHVFDDGYQMIRVGKKAAGRELDGQVHHAFPEGSNHG